MDVASKVLGIGASAGGITALSHLLPALRGASRTAVIVIQHLHPQSRVTVAEVYGPLAGMELREAEEKEALLAGRVYFAPPGYHLLVERDKTISLTVDAPCNWARPSIDVTFQSLARVFKDLTIALLLTGANRDGAEGCRQIKLAGGIVAVQDPHEAEASAMPTAALEVCTPDHVGTLQELAALLRGWVVGRQI